MLQAALEMSMDPDVEPPATAPASGQEIDFASMTEDEQIAYALQMSMQTTPEGL